MKNDLLIFRQTSYYPVGGIRALAGVFTHVIIKLYMEKKMLEIQDMGNGLFVVKINMNEVLTLDVPELKEKLQQAILSKDIKKLVLDLSDVKMITSSGIGIFLNINQSLKSSFRLAAPQPEVEKVLELTKVTSVVKLFSTVDAALKSF